MRIIRIAKECERMGAYYVRYLVAFLAFLTSLAAAESQEDLYYRALKAEESGDISRALTLFEEAVAQEGPYTAEIQEIIDDYQDALGDSDGESLEKESPWEFHTYGNVGYSWLHYKRGDVSTAETGSELVSSVNASLEYNSQKWVHSFEINMAGDWFVDKDDLTTLDVDAWEASLGLGYSLVGSSLILDIGADMNVSENDDWAPDFYLWAEKYFARMDKHKFGVSVFGYEDMDGPLYSSLFLAWHRYVKYGWKSSVYVGGRFEADSSTSYNHWLKWLGPSLKPSLSYRFKTEISVNAKLNFFYGFVVDGPNSDYEKFQKFNGSWSCSVSWDPGILGLFVGAEQFYRRYMIPAGYTISYAKKSRLTELKAGVKWNL